MKFRIYLETDLNRVFTKSLGAIAAAELDVILTHRLGTPETKIFLVEDGRTSFLDFDFDGEREPLVEQLGRLSATAAAFAVHTTSRLEPLPLREQLAFGTEVVTAQRYKGKTSERLTRLCAPANLRNGIAAQLSMESLFQSLLPFLQAFQPPECVARLFAPIDP